MKKKEISTLGKLRPIEDHELGHILSWRNATPIRSNMYNRHEISMQEHIAWWANVKTRSDQKYFMYEHNTIPLGINSFIHIDTKNHNAEWGIYAAPNAPKGTGRKMALLALDYAFQDIKLHKLYCEALSFNERALRLYHKFGFRDEGIFRQQHLYENKFIDIIRLGLLASEWKNIRANIYKELTITFARHDT